MAKTRYRQQDEACVVLRADEATLELEFERPQWAVTPGQSVVVYSGARCLGGAMIGNASVSEPQATPGPAMFNTYG
jgi:tRNA-uridine 2-sulfurtransferase